MLVVLLTTLALSPPGATVEQLEADVRSVFDEACTTCHDAEDDLNMEVSPGTYVGMASEQSPKPMVAPGDPDGSYLMDKLLAVEGIEGDLMPPDEPLSQAELDLVHAWIVATGEDASTQEPGLETPTTATSDEPAAAPQATPQKPKPAPKRPLKPFHGTDQITLPTTTTLGKRVLQYRIDHRFGEIGAERGAFGLDVGAIISFGLAYGILDGWDVRLRRTNSRKGYELGTKYVGLRQEAGMPVSLGGYASVEYFRDFEANIENPWGGSFMAMVSRLWWERWSTMFTLGYHLRTNHNPRVTVDLGDGPVRVWDRRDTLTLGLASTVWVDRRKRWGIDLEYLLPIPDGGDPRNAFYYRGGDADPSGTKIGAWALGGSYRLGRHLFQVFFTNNREIHTNLAAPGGQTANPFPIGERPSFFLGFNLSRTFKL